MRKQISIDIVIWIISIVICLIWRLAADKAEIWSYLGLFAVMMLVWIAIGAVFQLYRSYKKAWYWQSLLSLALTATAMLLLCRYALPELERQFSTTVAMWMVGIVTFIDFFAILAEHYWKYAQNMTVPAMKIEQREYATVVRPDERRRETTVETIHQSVLSITTEEDYQMLLEKARLDNRQTKVVANRDRFSFLQIPDYEYNTVVDLTLLNDAKGINRRFCIVNQKLPDEGRYVCCYRPQEYIKRKILNRYPAGIRWIVYSGYFFWKRVIPRLLLMSRLYYDLTKGRKRMLSKTEVFGRLYYCGFEVDEVVPMGHIEYVFAHRHSQPYPQRIHQVI